MASAPERRAGRGDAPRRGGPPGARRRTAAAEGPRRRTSTSPTRCSAGASTRSRPPLPFTPGVEICGETEDGRRVIANPALPYGGFAEYAIADDGRRAARARRAGRRGGRRPAHRLPDRLVRPAPPRAPPGGRDPPGARGRRRRRQRRRPARQGGRAPRSSASSAAPTKAEVARELGCDVVIDRRTDDVIGAVKEATGGRGADVDLRPGRRRRLHPVHEVRRLRGPHHRRRLRERRHPDARAQPRPGEELLDPRPALGPLQHQGPAARSCAATRSSPSSRPRAPSSR